MLCLTDTDVVAKLAELDALDDVIKHLGFSYNDVAVSPGEIFKLRKLVPEKLSGEGLARVEAFRKKVRGVANPDRGVFARLNGSSCVYRGRRISIDRGEAIMLAVASTQPQSVFVSGDKNAMRVLCDSPTCCDIADSLAGRVICFEQTLKMLIRKRGYTWTRQQAVRGSRCDQFLQTAFATNANDFPEKQCLVWIDGATQELKAETKSLLCGDDLLRIS